MHASTEEIKKDTLTVGTLKGDQRFLLTKSSDHIALVNVRHRSRSNPQVPKLIITPIEDRVAEEAPSSYLSLRTCSKSFNQ